MRIVSLNAWGGREWSALSDWVPRVGSDILCLQEVIRAPVASPEWLEYKDPFRTLSQRSDLYADVSKLLPTHQASFAPAARGNLSDGKRPVLSEHGIASWVAPHLAVTAQRHDFAHGTFRPNGWGAEPVPRAIMAQRIWDPSSGRTVLIAQFHGLRDPSGKGDTPARRAQSVRVIAFLAEIRRPGEPCILAGDLNVLPDNPMFDELAAIGLSDLVTGRGHADTRTSLYTKPQRYADYMLVSQEIRVSGFDVPAEPEVSDHRPLILDFEL